MLTPATHLVSRRISVAGGLFALAIGASAMAGWALDITDLKSFGYPLIMKANAALCLMLAGASLAALPRARAGLVWFGRAAAAVTLLVAAVTLSEHLFGWQAGIDELLFPEEAGSPATTSPGRMGPNASVSLTMLSVALLLLYGGGRRAATQAQGLALVATTFATVAILGYLYGARQLYALAFYTAIALPTAITLLALSLGVLMARPDVPPMASLVSATESSVVARRLLLPAVGVPLLLGAASIAAQRAQLTDAELGTALTASVAAILLAASVWRAAAILERSARARAEAERERDALLVREQEARDQAERANALKDEFLAMMSHELRTPLNTVMGWADILRSAHVPADRRQRAADVVARNARVLSRIVRDLLDVSRLTAGQLRLTRARVDVAAMSRAVVETFSLDAGASGIGLHWHPPEAPVMVDGDEERLQQVLSNLLGNALKFTAGGGRVDVRLDRDGARVRLQVADTGRGIDAEFLPYVFARFRQADSSATREKEGLGLGLAIVQDLVRLHDGEVTAESDGPGRGAVFTVWLPAAD